MRLTIFSKLFLSLLLICIVVMSGMAWVINSSFRSGLQNYLNQDEIEKGERLAQQVSRYYSETYQWDTLKQRPELWAHLLMQMGEPPPPRRKGPERPTRPGEKPAQPPKAEFLPLSFRINLLDISGNSVLGKPDKLSRRPPETHRVKIAISHNEQTVGWITIVQKDNISAPLAESFYKHQVRNFYIIAALAALFSFVIAAVLVRHFLKPLKNVHQGAKALSGGNYHYQIQVSGNDELAELSEAFNQLAESLKTQKSTREQWLTDISHELRTPLAVLRSEIEAIQDGIRKPEAKYIQSLHEQTLNLGKLVDDLYVLSLSDAGVTIDATHPVNITQLIERTLSQNEVRLNDKHIRLDRNYQPEVPLIINADEKSLSQLINNLVENSYRYTEPGGTMSVSLYPANNAVELIIEDSHPSVPTEALPKLFDRLYRVDKSRSRANGGSGLGLSICQNIVNAHRGTIKATHSDLGGLKIRVLLPAKEFTK